MIPLSGCTQAVKALVAGLYLQVGRVAGVAEKSPALSSHPTIMEATDDELELVATPKYFSLGYMSCAGSRYRIIHWLSAGCTQPSSMAIWSMRSVWG